jgi:membrane associated rhomboid family serine protease
LICELYQQGGLAPFTQNPMGGPSDSTMVQMGAKLGSLIIEGDWWRLGTALFCQNGIISLALTAVVAYLARGLERDSGFWRACMLFLISGLYGYIISSLFIPDALTCGSTGSTLGYIGLQLCDLYTTWRILTPRERKMGLGSLAIMAVVLFLVGLTPYVDNWAHFGGLIMGILFAVMLLPNFAFRRANRIIRGILAFIAFPLMATVFMLCLVLLFRKIDSVEGWCPGCYKFNALCLFEWCTPYHQGV